MRKHICRSGRGELHKTSIAPAGMTYDKRKGASWGALRRIQAVALAVAFGLSPAFAQPPAPAPNALPTGGQVAAGQAAISQAGSRMTVNQATPKVVLNWQSFDIGQDAAVTYLQPNSSSVALNRVLSLDPSRIYGHLSANGQLFLVNPAGVLFGKSARIDVGSLGVSTLSIKDSDFLFGKYAFEKAGSAGAISNEGRIQAANGGYVAFIAPRIANSGEVIADQGMVAMAAGNKVSLDFVGDKLINFTIDKGAVDALIENRGLIKADEGTVILSAKAADSVSKAVVNNSGVIEAKAITEKGGRILLLSDMDHGETIVGGKLDASAPNGGDGGFIETSGAKVTVRDDAHITTAAPYGNAGAWLIDPKDYTIAASGGDITGATLSSNLGSGNVTILSSGGSATANGDINVNDTVSWSANRLTLTAARDVNINAVMTASGTSTLTMNTATANGGDSAVSGGTVKVGLNSSGFTGRVDFPSRSGTGILTINGSGYTIINSLGVFSDYNSGSNQTLQGMARIANQSGKFALGTNIDASSTSTWDSDNGFYPIQTQGNPFSGIFDGLGHTISGLTINRPTTNYVGLFAATWDASSIRNVGLTGGSITGQSRTGGIVGSCSHSNNSGSSYTSYIINSYNTGSVTATNASQDIGGLVGGVYSLGSVMTYISNSYNTGTVQAANSFYVGGLVGTTYYTDISNSYNTGNVTGGKYASGVFSDTGGLVGNAYYPTTISNSYNTGAVSGSGDRIGGLVGYFMAMYSTNYIQNSYNTGTVSSVVGSTSSRVGGLIGEIGNSGSNVTRVTNSYNTGAVSATMNASNQSYAGGLVGWASGGVSSYISKSYNTGNVTGTGAYVGGVLGFVSFSIGGTNLYDSYNTGAVSAGKDASNYSYAGGVAGYLNAGTISRTYNSGTVTGTGSYVGGVVGYRNSTLQTSFYDKTVNPSLYGVGGTASDTAGQSYGMTTANMQTKANFTSATAANGNSNPNWDFATTPVWRINPSVNSGYPCLAAFGSCVASPAYVRLNAGSSTYGSTPSLTYTLYDASSGGSTVSDASPSGTATWSTFLSATSAAGTYAETYSSGLSSSFYTLTAGNAVNWVINPRALTITANNASKTYGQTTTFAGTEFSSSGLQNSETIGSVTLTSAGAVSTASVSGSPYSIVPSVATGGTFTASNYTIAYTNGSLTITQKALTLSGLSADNKTYDGNTTATVSSFGSLTGIVGSDTVSLNSGSSTANFDNKNVGTGKTVTAANLALSGADSGNYSIANQTTTANIAAKALTLSGLSADNKTYDGNTTATVSSFGSLTGIVGSDTVSLNSGSSTANFDNKNVGTGKTVTAANLALSGADSGNYSIANQTTTANIAAKALSISGLSSSNKVYDATTTASVSGTPALLAAEAPGAGNTSDGKPYTGDAINITGSASGNFNSKDVASATTVTFTGLALDNSNYSVTNPTAANTLSAKALSISGSSAANKTYDGNTTATVTAGSLSGMVGTETLGVNGSGIFDTKNVGTGKTVAAAYTLSDGTNGGVASNYSLAGENLSANIAAKALSISGSSAVNKTYDGNTTATVTAGSLSGMVGTETLGVNGSGIFDTKNVGTGKTVAAAYTLSDGTNGGVASNYSLAGENLSANITAKALSITAQTNTKTYDGTTAAAAIPMVSGLQGTDTVTGLAEVYDNSNAGTGKTLTVSAYTINDGNSGNNYAVTTVNDTTGVINEAAQASTLAPFFAPTPMSLPQSTSQLTITTGLDTARGILTPILEIVKVISGSGVSQNLVVSTAGNVTTISASMEDSGGSQPLAQSEMTMFVVKKGEKPVAENRFLAEESDRHILLKSAGAVEQDLSQVSATVIGRIMYNITTSDRKGLTFTAVVSENALSITADNGDLDQLTGGLRDVVVGTALREIRKQLNIRADRMRFVFIKSR